MWSIILIDISWRYKRCTYLFLILGLKSKSSLTSGEIRRCTRVSEECRKCSICKTK